jgi:tight adherence protein B
MLFPFILSFVIFTIAMFIAAHYAFKMPQQATEDKLLVRLREVRGRATAGQRVRAGGSDLIRRESQGTFSFFAAFLDWVKPLKRLQQLIEQADLKYRATDIFTVSVIIFLVMFGFFGLIGLNVLALRLVFAGLCAAIPTMYIMRKRASRLHKFETMLPDAIDLFNRSMKAGHNIHGGLETVASETADPVQKEFKKVMEELALGSQTEQALHHLGERVPLIDLKFFITGLILQRQTGANMVEMLENLAMLIRERLNLAEKLKAGTASQRFSAGLVCGIPVFMFIVYYFMKPEYTKLLLEDETGNMILTGAACLEVVGILVIRKMSSPKF